MMKNNWLLSTVWVNFISVEKSNSHVATTGGIYYRRLGNVTKPDYPANDVYSPADNPDFSAKIVEGATESDIDLLEVYRLKEKLRIRDAGSALPDLADTTFLSPPSALASVWAS